MNYLLPTCYPKQIQMNVEMKKIEAFGYHFDVGQPAELSVKKVLGLFESMNPDNHTL